jgi:hypothetical protein
MMAGGGDDDGAQTQMLVDDAGDDDAEETTRAAEQPPPQQQQQQLVEEELVGDDLSDCEDDVARGQEQHQRPSTPTRGGTRGIGASSLQQYLSSVGDSLTPEDETPERDHQAAPSPKQIGIDELRAEAQGARDVLAVALADIQSRQQRDSARHASVSRLATSILASARELREEQSASPVEQKDMATQTEPVDGLAPLTELRIEDDADMTQLMLLTAQVAVLVAHATAAPATAAASGGVCATAAASEDSPPSTAALRAEQ